MDSNKIQTIDNLDILIALNEFAVEGRYAIIHDDFDDIDNLNRLIEFVKQELKIRK